MTSTTPDMQAVFARLEKLEQQNRRFQRAGALALMAVTAIVVMGQAAPKDRTVEAERFVLRDTKGTMRAEIAMLQGGAALRFFNLKEEEQATFAEDGLALFTAGHGREPQFSVVSLSRSGLWFAKENGQTVLLLGGPSGPGDNTPQPHLILFGPREQPRIALLGEEDSGPSIQLTGADGFKSVVGVSDLVTEITGETHKTSAASLRMFNKGAKVIWRAP